MSDGSLAQPVRYCQMLHTQARPRSENSTSWKISRSHYRCFQLLSTMSHTAQITFGGHCNMWGCRKHHSQDTSPNEIILATSFSSKFTESIHHGHQPKPSKRDHHVSSQTGDYQLGDPKPATVSRHCHSRCWSAGVSGWLAALRNPARCRFRTLGPQHQWPGKWWSY